MALCDGLTGLEIVTMLRALRKGRFSGLRKTRSKRASTVEVSADRVFALETDGEIEHASSARFRVAPTRLSCCV